MTSQMSVPLSRIKLFAAIAGCVVFVGVGWWLFKLTDAEILSQRRYNNPTLVHAIGVSAIIMAGVLVPWLLKKLFDASPGLQFLDEGLVENTNMFSVGLIAWEDITGLQVRQIRNQQLLYVLLRDPEKYICRCGPIKRAMLHMSLRLGPSPVTITSNSLRMKFADVLTLVESNLSKHSNA